MASSLTLIFVLCFTVIPGLCYRPVAIIHGILDIPDTMNLMAEFIQKAHPGTKVLIFDILHGYQSLNPMWKQVQQFGYLLSELMRSSKDGLHLIGYSQGGLVSRGILESMQHNVHTFVSLSSPQMGQYGDTDFLRLLFPNYVKSNIYKFFYSSLGQKISVGNYWKDPHHVDLYRNYSSYLALLNNETKSPNITEFKENFLHLKKLVLIGGPDDGVITPWQSSHFGFFDTNEEIVEMRQQPSYSSDCFGLKTLDKRKAIFTHSISGISHLEWHRNMTIIRDYILPYLD